MALLIIGMLALGFYAADLDNSPLKIRLFFWHKSFGILIFALASFRLLWRFSHRPPDLPESMPSLEKKAAKTTHGLLYGLMFGLPLSGWLIHSAAGYPFKVFAWFSLPALIAVDKASQEQAATVHEIAAWLLLALLALHLLATLKHHFVDRDNVFNSMRIPRRYAVALIACVLFFVAFAYRDLPAVVVNSSQSASKPAINAAAEVEATTQGLPIASASAWAMLPAVSKLSFTGTYDEVEFAGVFHRFTPVLRFSPQQLAVSEFDVRIDVTSVDTQSSDRDDALAGAEWFGFTQYPQARFLATKFKQLSARQFAADGQLTIRDISQPLRLVFNWVEQAGQAGQARQAKLSFEIELNRLDFDIGTGMWAGDTIGHVVKLRADLTLESAE